MAQNWRNEDYRRRDHRTDWRDDRDYRSGQDYQGEDTWSGRGRDPGHRSEYGRGADMSPGRPGWSRGDEYGSQGRSSWSGRDEERGRDYGSPHRDYGRGPYEDYGADLERFYGSGSMPPSGLGYGRSGDRSYDFTGHGDYGRGYGGGRSRFEESRHRGRPDWGRQEWGMSGPQQSNWDYDREERGFWDRASDEVSSWFGDEDAERRRHMDQFRGKGPKNYSRSDDRIREDVSDRLTDDWQVDASEIEVSVAKGEVTLTGTVAERHQRRRAEDIAERVSGVSHVHNNLRVRGMGATPGSQTGTQTAITPGQSSTISSKGT